MRLRVFLCLKTQESLPMFWVLNKTGDYWIKILQLLNGMILFMKN